MSTLKVDTIKSDTTPTVTISDGLSVSGVTTSTGDVSIADKIIHTGDTNTAIRFPAADTITAETGGSERLRISSGGAVGINTTASSYPFQVQTDGTSTTVGGNIVARFQSSGAAGRDATIQLSDNVSHSATISMLSSNLAFANAGTESVRIDSSGRLLLGHTADIGFGFRHQLVGTDGNTSSQSQSRFSANASGPSFVFSKSRNATPGSNTIVNDGDTLGLIQFRGDDGGDYLTTGAQIEAKVDGTPGANDLPTRLTFATTADGANSATERLRITSAGAWGIAGANYGTSGQVLTSGGSGAAVSWASVSGGPTHYSKFTLESVQGNQNPINNWDLYSPGISPTINTAVTNTNGVFSFPATGIWECQASILFYLNGGTTEFRLETYGTTDDGSNWDIIGRQYGWFHNNSSTNYMSVSTMPFLLDITNTSNCKVKFVIAGGPGTLYTGGDDNDLYSGCHFIRWADT